MSTATTEREQFEGLVRDTADRLIDGGIRVIELAALYDQVQRTGAKQGKFAPDWASLVSTLEGMDGYEVSGFEVTLPRGEAERVKRPCLLEAVYRVIDGIDVYKGVPVPGDHDAVINWAREVLATAAPEREE